MREAAHTIQCFFYMSLIRNAVAVNNSSNKIHYITISKLKLFKNCLNHSICVKIIQKSNWMQWKAKQSKRICLQLCNQIVIILNWLYWEFNESRLMKQKSTKQKLRKWVAFGTYPDYHCRGVLVNKWLLHDLIESSDDEIQHLIKNFERTQHKRHYCDHILFRPIKCYSPYPIHCCWSEHVDQVHDHYEVIEGLCDSWPAAEYYFPIAVFWKIVVAAAAAVDRALTNTIIPIHVLRFLLEPVAVAVPPYLKYDLNKRTLFCIKFNRKQRFVWSNLKRCMIRKCRWK